MASTPHMPAKTSISNKITKNSAPSILSFNSYNKSKKFERRQETDNNKNTNKKVSSISDIPDIATKLIPEIPTFTETSSLPTDTTLLPTDTTSLPTDTATVSPTDTSVSMLSEPSPSDTTINIDSIQTQNPSQPTSTATSTPGLDTNGTRSWLFPIITALLLIILLFLIFLGFFIRKRKRNANNANNNNDHYLRNIDNSVNDEEKVIGNMISMDKEKENNSKSNSLTSLTSISSSFKMKKGKVVPADVNIASSPATPTTLSSPPIVANNDDEGPSPPFRVKRAAKTKSAFTEIVDLTEEENNNLRKSVSTGIYTITSRFSNISNVSSGNIGSGERSSVNTVTPLQQERIESMILSPKANTSPSAIGSSSVNNNHSRIVTFATPPSDTSSSDDNDTRHSI
ncbi:1719_t:CDS:2 [Funneliformis caledonium]|uniref:1719_t:CDS:1 n=1 Tax=Funneliformis caledonium TaxID=1117310 RepID=A0A9N9BCI7_9GLOM|nr:1719_t:CDS:2 [Funneliformis caledonium]